MEKRITLEDGGLDLVGCSRGEADGSIGQSLVRDTATAERGVEDLASLWYALLNIIDRT